MQYTFVVFSIVCFVVCSSLNDVSFDANLQPAGYCPVPRVYDTLEEWIFHSKQKNYGWKENTHRANIALAVGNEWRPTEDERKLMDMQLEVELTRALMRNASHSMHPNDLALFIHALVATGKNPRNFRGIDIVADLMHIVESLNDVHPFLVLALCNARAVEFLHLQKIKRFLEHRENESRHQIELKALARKAFACAASLDGELDKFRTDMERAAKCLVSKQQEDGSFGNEYTTSLAVQALVAYPPAESRWKRDLAMQNLRLHSNQTTMNLVKAYYLLLALNMDRILFLKDIHPHIKYEPEPPQKSLHYVLVSVRSDLNETPYYTITMRVPSDANFFEIMKMCSDYSSVFRFKTVTNKRGEPIVYSVSGIPDDAEQNLYWRICIENARTRLAHAHHLSPALLKPEADDHIIFWYRDSECPEGKNQLHLKQAV